MSLLFRVAVRSGKSRRREESAPDGGATEENFPFSRRFQIDFSRSEQEWTYLSGRRQHPLFHVTLKSGHPGDLNPTNEQVGYDAAPDGSSLSNSPPIEVRPQLLITN
jgi:hypothetical protein